MNLWFKTLSTALLLLSSFLAIPSAVATPIDITVFHTNDVHGRGFSDDKIGYAKITQYINDYKNHNDNVLFLDAGDTLYGLPVIDISSGKTAIDVLNLMQYDALTLGNGDFVYGGIRAQELAQMANFPVLSANLFYKNEHAFTPYIIKEVAGIKIAIIGISPMNSMVAASESKMEGFSIKDPIVVVKKIVSEIQDQVDFILVLAHIGKNDKLVNIEKLVDAVPNIDLIVDGHDHIKLDHGLQIGNTFVVNSGEYNDYLGKVVLTFDNKKLIAKQAQLLDKNDLKDTLPNKAIKDFINNSLHESEKFLQEVVTSAPFYIEGRRNYVRSMETDLGSILADAEREYTGADIAFTVGAFLRDSFESGDITREKLFSVLPFRLPPVTRSMTGKQIIDFFEHTYEEKGRIMPAYTHISGMTFTVDFNQPIGNRIIKATVGNEPIDLDKSYIVTCNEQVSDYNIRTIPILKYYDKSMAEILTDYLNKNQTLSKPEKRVTILN